MKLRIALFIALISLLLAACNMTLAEDVTPPPGYVPPTPAATHGPVFPAQAPDLQNGAVIYAEKCADCHGAKGLGDGDQGKQLPVSVPPLGVSELAWQAAPADWYLVVTLGNIEKFMPPFASLNDQERWDVVSYAHSLSNTPEQISQGEELFNQNCADCSTNYFTDQESIVKLSTNDLVDLLTNGGEGIPALGDSLSNEEIQAVAVYLRSLSFASPVMAKPVPTVEVTEEPSEGDTPTEGEQAEVTPEAPAEVIIGTVSGKLVNASGGDIPSDVTVTLLGFEHAGGMGTTPLEVLNETVKTDQTGKYTFEDIEIPEGRIFMVEANYQGIAFQSELVLSEADMTEVSVPDTMLYESTTDTGGLVIEQLHISFDMTGEGQVQVFELYTISNLSDKAYTFTTDGTSLPFMPLPKDALNVGLELSQDSAALMATDEGFAMPPTNEFYSIIAYFNMPYDQELTLEQPFVMPVSSALVIVPDGIKVKTDQLIDEGLQQTQQGFNVQMFSGEGLSANSSLKMTLSGKVKSAATGTTPDSRQLLLIGAGALGLVLILAGVWMFLRDRSGTDDDDDDFEDDEEDEEAEFESAEEVMDAIIALDDLHRGKKISDEAYQKRRAELKELLKELA